jgi:hypothetical protein
MCSVGGAKQYPQKRRKNAWRKSASRGSISHPNRFLLSPTNPSSGWSISRILSSGLLRLGSHLSGRCVAAPLGAAYPGLTHPKRGVETYGDEQSPIVHRRNRPCLALLPAGVTWPRALLRAPVVSYTTFSPSLPCGSCLFLWPFSGRFIPSTNDRLPRPGCYPTPCSIGVRTFLDPVNAGPRLPDQPEAFS